MRVLIIKHSAMGDLVQALPALSDARDAIPELSFDWVADERFAEIPGWHPAVGRVIPSAIPRWRKQPFLSQSRREMAEFRRTLRSIKYDLVIDAQGNLKSAATTALARGEKHGLNHRSVREVGANLAYAQRHAVERNQLAASRWRQLFGKSLNYSVPSSAPDFGLGGVSFPANNLDMANNRYLVFVHNASWASKLWPQAHWQALLKLAHAEQLQVLLPWGNDQEQSAAHAIAAGHNNATVLPKLNLARLAGLLQNAQGALCTDTGLAHLSAALGTPTVSIYGPTDPKLIAATGPRSVHAQAEGYDCMPCYKRHCTFVENNEQSEFRPSKIGQAACLQAITPEKVWREFCLLTESGRQC